MCCHTIACLRSGSVQRRCVLQRWGGTGSRPGDSQQARQSCVKTLHRAWKLRQPAAGCLPLARSRPLLHLPILDAHRAPGLS